MLINNNIIYLENIIVNMFTRVLIIGNCNIIALLIYISSKNRVNRIATT
jgi:hypothetical protein